VISEALKRPLLKLMDFSKNQVFVIPNGVNLKRFLEIDDTIWKVQEKYRLLERFPLILSPVNILERKNLEYNVEIVNYLKKDYPKLCLLITGYPSRHRSTVDYLNKLKYKINTFNLNDQIVFLYQMLKRSLKESELHDLYSLSDIVFYFSKSENFGLPLLESALSKTPIFVSNLVVFREIAGETVYYLDYKETPAIKAAQIVKSYLKTNKIIQANHQVRTKYDLKNILKEKLLPLF
jgi:glycosyltransferase involved in cell wall biosynthesis